VTGQYNDILETNTRTMCFLVKQQNVLTTNKPRTDDNYAWFSTLTHIIYLL
jgi:hypothetical protein